MFERFTDRARRVLVLAQEDARALHDNVIGSEHILLGLIREGDGVAARALESTGVTLEVVRHLIAEASGPPVEATRGSTAFTPEAKRLLQGSLEEATTLASDSIGTEHLLLGLLRDDESGGAQVLVGVGADLAELRHKVILLSAVGARRDTVTRQRVPWANVRRGQSARPQGGGPRDDRAANRAPGRAGPQEPRAPAGQVDLILRDRHDLRGSWSGWPVGVHLDLDGPTGLSGRFGPEEVLAHWSIATGAQSFGDVPFAALGRIGSAQLTLHGSIVLGDDGSLARVTIGGALGDDPISLSVDWIESGVISSDSSVTTPGPRQRLAHVTGAFAGVELQLFAHVGTDDSGIRVSGTLGGTVGASVALEAMRHGDGSRRLSGEFAGPGALLLLLAGPLLSIT